MRGTPKNRFSLAEMRAKNRMAKVQRPNLLTMPSLICAKTPNVAISTNSCHAMVPQARRNRSHIGAKGGQGRVFGPAMMPDRKASSIQPQMASAATKAMKAPVALPLSRLWIKAPKPPISSGRPRMTDHRCASRPSRSARLTRQMMMPVENHHRNRAATAATHGLVMHGTPHQRGAAQGGGTRPSRRRNHRSRGDMSIYDQ